MTPQSAGRRTKPPTKDQQFRLDLKRLRASRARPLDREDRPITHEQWDALAWAFENRVLSLPDCQHHIRGRFCAKLKFCLTYEHAFAPRDRSSFRRAVMSESFLRYVELRKPKSDQVD